MSELKVQFGCGSNILEGWENHDGEVDITKELPYKENSVDFILIEHCLEHVNCACGMHFLMEARRILKPGGVLRVCVPAALEMPTREHCIDLITGHGHQMIFNEQVLARMLDLAAFTNIGWSKRKEIDGHHKVIGLLKDDLETLRMEAVK